jgi:hypothetical protein
LEEIGRNPVERHPQIIENGPSQKKSTQPECHPDSGSGTIRACALAAICASRTDHSAFMLDHTLATIEAPAPGTSHHRFPIRVMPASLMN